MSKRKRSKKKDKGNTSEQLILKLKNGWFLLMDSKGHLHRLGKQETGTNVINVDFKKLCDELEIH